MIWGRSGPKSYTDTPLRNSHVTPCSILPLHSCRLCNILKPSVLLLTVWQEPSVQEFTKYRVLYGKKPYRR